MERLLNASRRLLAQARAVNPPALIYGRSCIPCLFMCTLLRTVPHHLITTSSAIRLGCVRNSVLAMACFVAANNAKGHVARYRRYTSRKLAPACLAPLFCSVTGIEIAIKRSVTLDLIGD